MTEPIRWVLTDKGREALKEIRESQSGADALGASAGERSARVGPTV